MRSGSPVPADWPQLCSASGVAPAAAAGLAVRAVLARRTVRSTQRSAATLVLRTRADRPSCRYGRMAAAGARPRRCGRPAPAAERGGTIRSRLRHHDQAGRLQAARAASAWPATCHAPLAGSLSPYQPSERIRAPRRRASGTPSLIQSSSATKARAARRSGSSPAKPTNLRSTCNGSSTAKRALDQRRPASRPSSRQAAQRAPIGRAAVPASASLRHGSPKASRAARDRRCRAARRSARARANRPPMQ